MNTTLSEVSRLDVSQVFWEVDDFCRTFEQQCLYHPQLPSMPGERLSQSKLSRSEVMTIVIAFQGSGYRTFKEFYTLCVLPGWRHTEGIELLKGAIQPLRRTDAVVPDAALLLSLHPHGGNDRPCLHRLNADRSVPSSSGQVSQGVPRPSGLEQELDGLALRL